MNRTSHQTVFAMASKTLPVVALALGIGVGGCVPDDTEATLGTNTYRTDTGNGLPGNGLPGNGLPGNGLPGNGLPGNGLPDGTLLNNGLADAQSNQDWSDWLNDAQYGALHDTLMKYVVLCALADGDSASYTDSNNNTWQWDGLLGLAPGWDSASITLSEQKWVTSCVAALVNEDGQNVQVSVRGPGSSAYEVTNVEIVQWDEQEGAFFGNMFASSPVYYACSYSLDYTDPGNGRVCTMTDANGDSRCSPIEALGLCSDICSSVVMDEPGITGYTVFYDCEDPDDNVWAEVTTVAQSDD